nr:immunoglobulin light chain junction region [Macaca mulatta]MOW10725.1 immunoglobulin light chain junction region [Macaca mulatta]MOW11311.1 immunoglobulin light chain junction region [Macaca mulatta]MOW14296.1 immunoglobulin light chain junction region [Macaca mulatta]
CLQYNTSPYTF